MIKKMCLSIFALGSLFNQSSLHAGVYVLCDVPQAKEIINQTQDALESKVQEINKQKQTEYIFQKLQFSPHISLAFLCQDTLTIADVLKKYPNIIHELETIATTFTATDVSENFRSALLTFWPGKFEIEFQKEKKHNYVNVVLKISENQTLKELAERVSELIKEKYGIEQKFPFSAHITIGRIFHKEDVPVTDPDKTFQIAIPLSKQATLLLAQFKLKGHDGSEKIFDLRS